LGIEIRADRPDVLKALEPLAHRPTWLAVSAERAVSLEMGGSCSMPLAAHAVWRGDTLQMEAAWGVVNDAPAAQAARPLLRVSGAGAPVDLLQAQTLGRSLALQLCAAGAVRSQA
jgi:hydroxymethylbilane synthase